MSIIVGIDIGGSTTKIVGFDGDRLLEPLMVRATDPIASVYGAFGKFTYQHGITLADISEVHITGVGSVNVLVISNIRSAKVLLPWSICAMMQKFLVFFIVILKSVQR